MSDLATPGRALAEQAACCQQGACACDENAFGCAGAAALPPTALRCAGAALRWPDPGGARAADVNLLKLPSPLELPDEKVVFLSDILPTAWCAARSLCRRMSVMHIR